MMMIKNLFYMFLCVMCCALLSLFFFNITHSDSFLIRGDKDYEYEYYFVCIH